MQSLKFLNYEGAKIGMKSIKHIFDGDFGCEETNRKKPTVLVTLIDEFGNESYVTVEDEWLTKNGLNIGDTWPEEDYIEYRRCN